ncbi:MAG TPA: hypothetical protein VGM65_05505 [Candidatus Udaeobacter sp.]|jgi:hypothetical protein
MFECFEHRAYLTATMIKITTTALVAVAMLMASNAFAGDHACCAHGASKANLMACVNLATLNLTADQKTKIEAWQAECLKAGCTKKSRQTFLTHAKEILSPDQFAQLKAQCKRTGAAKKSEA